jgi:hypothetical protein
MLDGRRHVVVIERHQKPVVEIMARDDQVAPL